MIGRPLEIVPLCLDVFTITWLITHVSNYVDKNLLFYGITSLLVSIMMTGIMVFSHTLFDTAFQLSHIFQVLVVLPLICYLWGVFDNGV